MKFSPEDHMRLGQIADKFRNRSMAAVFQSLIHESMCKGRFKDATTLMELLIRENLETFASEQPLTDSTIPSRSFYDSACIMGLQISTAINVCLIKCTKAEGD